KVVKAAVIKEVYATYAILPGLDNYRPEAKTGWPRIFLAGDWTATGWPATMEGAVRSGYLAAEAITGQKFVVADLPAKGLMREFSVAIYFWLLCGCSISCSRQFVEVQKMERL